jgi:predicted ABC-type ATPase
MQDLTPETFPVRPRKHRPKVYVIAGPNGSGKTTFVYKFLPDYAGCLNFVNADLISLGLSPFSPETVALRSGKLMLEQIRSLSERGVDFGFETTLAGKTYVNLLKGLKADGYEINLFFLWLRDVELAIERIAGRVRKGGHDVPGNVVRRRYARGIFNLFRVYRALLDTWTLLDNSTESPRIVAYEDHGKLTIADDDLFETIMRSVKDHG